MRALVSTLALALALVTGCGEDPAEPPAPTGVAGAWDATFAAGAGRFDLYTSEDVLRGTLTVQGYAYVVTGSAAGADFLLVLLPSRNEAPLFEVLGLQLAEAPAFAPAHAADRLEFRGALAAGGQSAEGTVRSRAGAERPFTLARR